ncbi:MAG: hypothetical protein ACJ73S_05380 [Mycobacteriales bacterium]
MTAPVAQAATRVLDAGYDLSAALAAGHDPEAAADRLAAAIEASMTTFDGAVQGFAADAADAADAGRPPAPEAAEDLLAVAVGQLWVANVALGAGGAVGEQSGGGPGDLDAALAAFAATAGKVEPPPDGQRFGFTGPDAPPADLATSVTMLRDRAGATLDAVASGTAEVLTKAVTAVRDHGPAVVAKAWEQLDKRLDLDGFGGRLVRLGLRAVAAALDALHRLVPAARLLALRDRIRELADGLAAGRPATALARWALGIDGATAAVEADLGREGLQPGRLVLAAAALEQLAARHARLVRLAGGATVAIVGVGSAAGLLHLAMPHLAVAIAAAQLLVVGAALAIGRDFVDARAGTGWVRGVRVIVRAAVEPA